MEENKEMTPMEENKEMTPLEAKVVRQIEYYFGDHNLPRDKFLKEQLQLDDGWVTLETMLKFNRLKCLTEDAKVIVESLRKSKSGLMEVSEDETKVRRSPSKPLPEVNDEYREGLLQKSVYMKGFPLETTLDDIMTWLGGKCTVENVQMRRNLERKFKGSVFLVCETEAAAKEFMQRDDIKTFKDSEMLILLRADYHAKKKQEWKAVKSAKSKQDKDTNEKQADKEEMKSLDEQTGCLLKFSGALEFVSRSDFHELFSGHGQIKWIDFSRGAKEGTILFKESAKEALDKATEAHGGTLKLKDQDVTWEVVEAGEAEKQLLKKMIQDQQEAFSRGRGGRGGRGRSGGRGGGEGRRGGRGGGGRGGRRDRDRGGRDQNKSQYKGKKTVFDDKDDGNDDGDDGNDDAPPSPKKRALEGAETESPAAKVSKTENGS